MTSQESREKTLVERLRIVADMETMTAQDREGMEVGEAEWSDRLSAVLNEAADALDEHANARLRAYRAMRIWKPNDEAYRAAGAVYEAAFGENAKRFGAAFTRFERAKIVGRTWREASDIADREAGRWRRADAPAKASGAAWVASTCRTRAVEAEGVAKGWEDVLAGRAPSLDLDEILAELKRVATETDNPRPSLLANIRALEKEKRRAGEEMASSPRFPEQTRPLPDLEQLITYCVTQHYGTDPKHWRDRNVLRVRLRSFAEQLLAAERGQRRDSDRAVIQEGERQSQVRERDKELAAAAATAEEAGPKPAPPRTEGKQS